MDFVTPEYYLYFLPAVVFLTIGIASRKRRIQMLILLVMSYLFFWLASGWHILLLFISTCVDWTAGKKMHESENQSYRKRWLQASLIVNLTLLGIFKYLDFIIESLNFASLKFGSEASLDAFGLALPVGISFYTFQTMSYTIDIYRKKTISLRFISRFCMLCSLLPTVGCRPNRSRRSFPKRD